MRPDNPENEQRRADGVFYTPPALAQRLAEMVFAHATTMPERVVDPACGNGNLLMAVAERLLAEGLTWPEIVPRLFGVDKDPSAIAEARRRIITAAGAFAEPIVAKNFVAADALSLVDQGPARHAWTKPFDLVVANPPFGNAIDKRTQRSAEEKTRYARDYPHAAHGAYDKAALFVELATQWVRPGGIVAAILPRAMLSATYARKLRAHVDGAHRLTDVLDTTDEGLFDAAVVRVCALCIAVGAGAPLERVNIWRMTGAPTVRQRRSAHAGAWGLLLSPHAPLVERIPDDWVRLDAQFHLQAGATAGEAYQFVEGMSDGAVDDGWRLITTGAIDPFTVYWGVRPTRYLKKDYLHPYVSRHVVSARRAALYDRPKVMVAGLSKVLEAAVDDAGACAPAVSTVVACDHENRVPALHTLSAFLNGPLAREQYLAVNGVQAWGGASVQVNKAKLGALRVPPGLDWSAPVDWAKWYDRVMTK